MPTLTLQAPPISGKPGEYEACDKGILSRKLSCLILKLTFSNRSSFKMDQRIDYDTLPIAAKAHPEISCPSLGLGNSFAFTFPIPPIAFYNRLLLSGFLSRFPAIRPATVELLRFFPRFFLLTSRKVKYIK